MKISFCGIALVIFSASISAGESEYVDFFNKRNMPLGVREDEIRISDLVFPSKMCDAKDSFVCIKSKVFVFSVPKDRRINSWTRDGASYEILTKTQEAFIFGEILEYRIIRQKWKGNNIDYAYSDDRGVVAIKSRHGNYLVLSGKCGFSAISNSQACQ